jgi:hypothetical protein
MESKASTFYRLPLRQASNRDSILLCRKSLHAEFLPVPSQYYPDTSPQLQIPFVNPSAVHKFTNSIVNPSAVVSFPKDKGVSWLVQSGEWSKPGKSILDLTY